MPEYTYHCEHCEHEFNQQQSFYEDALVTCPSCKKKALRKVYKPAQVVFKGKGFYVTDTKGAKSNLTTAHDSKEESGNGKSETKAEKKEKKPEKSTEPKKKKETN